MSNWWNMDFTATGRESEIERLLKEVARLKLLLEVDPPLQEDLSEMLVKRWRGTPLFHTTLVKHRARGYVAMHASRNYFGKEAINELTGRFPDVLFTGTISTDMDCCNAGGWYIVFDAFPGDFTAAKGVWFRQYDTPEQRLDVD